MDVEIGPHLEPTKLFEEVIQDNVLTIKVPSVPNEFCLDSDNVKSIQPKLTYNTTTEFLPMMDPVSDSSIDNDPEYIDGILEVDGGRKRNKVNKKNEIKLIKNKLPNEWTVKCIHKDQIKATVCNIALLSADEISTFKNNVYRCTSKIEQDKFILTFVKVSAPKRFNRKKTDRINRTVTNYFIPAINGVMVKVCGVAFSSVTSLSKRRLNLVTKTFNITHSSPVKKRGGYHYNYIATETTQSIKDHIKHFKCRKSHHTRKDTGRCYLQPGLSIRYMCDNIQWIAYENRSDKKKF